MQDEGPGLSQGIDHSQGMISQRPWNYVDYVVLHSISFLKRKSMASSDLELRQFDAFKVLLILTCIWTTVYKSWWLIHHLVVRATWMEQIWNVVNLPAFSRLLSPSPQPGSVAGEALFGSFGSSFAKTGFLASVLTVGRKNGAASGFLGGWIGLLLSCTEVLYSRSIIVWVVSWFSHSSIHITHYQSSSSRLWNVFGSK